MLYKLHYRITVLCVLLCCACGMAAAQTSATWALTATTSVTVSGSNITAASQSTDSLTYAEYSKGYQRRANASKALPTAYDTAMYVQYAVTSASGYVFTVSSISMQIFCSGSSNGDAAIYYSLNSDFSSATSIYSSSSPLALSSSLPSSANVNYTGTITVASGQTLYVRVYPWLSSGGSTKYLASENVIISGTTQSSIAIIPSVSSLSGFTQSVSGTPSATQTYTVSGTNLTDVVTLAPPAGFDISTDAGSTWVSNGSTISLPVSSGTVTGQPVSVLVRLNATAAGAYTGAIYQSSTGAPTDSVSLSGLFYAAEPTTVSTVSFGTVTGNSIIVNFTGGNGSKRIVVVRPDAAVNWMPTDGVLVTGTNSTLTTATDQGNGNRAVYDGTGSSVTVTGLTANKTYYVAVYEYNDASGAAQNYLTSSAGTGSATTLAVPTIAVSTSSLSFGNVLLNATSSALNFSVSGVYLSPASGNITVTAPTGFAVSTTSASGYASSVTLPYTGSTLAATTVYVQFTPTSLVSYSGVISDTGGYATAVTVVVAGTGVSQIIQTSTPVGYASCGTGTTGGAGGDTTVITDVATLYSIITARQKSVTTPIILLIKGKLDGSSEADEVELKNQSNVSILGVGDDAVFYGFGCKIWNANNVIFRNISFQNCTAGEGDAVSIESCNQVWIDHCSFTDAPGDSTESSGGHDGLTDVKKGSTNVTISFNKYQDHRKTCLLGYSKSDNSDTATGVTYYMNWFQGTYSRHPRTRYAHPHVLNNYFEHAGTWGADSGGYAIGATCGCNVYSEANYFENVRTPYLISMFNDPEGVLSHDPLGYIRAVNDYFVNCFGANTTHDTTPYIVPSSYYSYTAADPTTVRATVRANAGVGHLSIGTSSVTATEQTVAGIPTSVRLKQNYPNPFNPSTRIDFAIPTSGLVTLKVYNILGQEVATLFNGYKSAGEYTVTFDAQNTRGGQMASGVYIYRLQVGSDIVTHRMVLIK